MANQSEILYKSLIHNASNVTYSGTETEGFEKENLTDYLDFSTFRPEVSVVTSLDFTVSEALTINRWSLFIKKEAHLGFLNIRLYYESSPSTYTLLDTVTFASGILETRTFTDTAVAVGRNIRIEFDMGSDTYDIRQIMVGPVFQLERGQYAGVNPPTLRQGVVMNNSISVNGALLGSSVKREKVTTRIDQEFLTESWERGAWEPFAIHASRGRGFFYQWNPTEYPDEVVYCMATKVDTPENISPTPLMKAGLTAICRQPDE